MRRPETYPRKIYLLLITNREDKAQSTIEFSLVFVLAILFLFLTCNLFVWLNHNVVQRQIGYEESRPSAASGHTRRYTRSDGVIIEETCDQWQPGTTDYIDYYTSKTLNVFTSGGRE